MTEAILTRNGPAIRAGLPRSVTGPAVLMMDPKYPHNVGMVVRLAACYGLNAVWYTGDRVELSTAKARIPREERMRDYAAVDLVQCERPFEHIKGTPVAVEMRPNAESLLEFSHPEDAIYIFGPEDGGLGRLTLQHCHRFIQIPTPHCLNVSTAAATVLYDRMLKQRMHVTYPGCG